MAIQVIGMPEKFWVVTAPTNVSELRDICFECTFDSLMLQTMGGLRADDIVVISADAELAKKVAEKILKKRDAGSTGPW